jgi:hypothetical protein
MIALDLDAPVLDGTAGSAELLQLLGQGFELHLAQRQSCNDRDSLARTTGNLTADANASVLSRVGWGARGAAPWRYGG